MISTITARVSFSSMVRLLTGIYSASSPLEYWPDTLLERRILASLLRICKNYLVLFLQVLAEFARTCYFCDKS